MIKLIKIFLCTFLALNSTATISASEDVPAGLSKCTDLDMAGIAKMWSDLSKLSRQHDVQSEVESFVDTLAILCGPDLSAEDAALLQRDADEVKRRGWTRQLELYSSTMEQISRYRSPKKEITKMLEIEILLGNSPYSTISQEKITHLISQGKAASESRQKTCTDVDNRKGTLKMPRDQDGVGWCYAYSAADLITHKMGTQVSAVDLANTFTRNVFGNEIVRAFQSSEAHFYGGWVDLVLKQALEDPKTGVCMESEIPSENYQNRNLEEAIIELENLVESYREYVNLQRMEGSPGILGVDDSRSFLYYNKQRHKTWLKVMSDCFFGPNPTNTLLLDLFPRLSMEDFVKVLQHTSRKNALNNLIQASCSRKTPKKKLTIRHESVSGRELFNIFDQQLNNGNILEVFYYSSILEDPWNENDGRHSSTVVARRFNRSTGSCEYMIRNSWGPGCSSYHQDYGCNNGMIWIPEDRLEGAAFGTTWLE